MPRSNCTFDGCNKPVHGRGLCPMHYRRFRLYGNAKALPSETKKRVKDFRCAAPGCDNQAATKSAMGLVCRTHSIIVEKQGNYYAPPPPTKEQRFWSKVDVRGISECWEWTGFIQYNGYADFDDEKAHRVALRMSGVDIPDGMIVMHSCDNRRCCNPLHLSVGTTADNINDMMRKGRHRSQRNREDAA